MRASTSAPARRPGRAAGRGFTLIEIVVVIVIIAVLSGMVLSSLAGTTESAALRDAAARLYRTAQYGQGFAVTRATTCRMVFDPQERRFLLEHEPDAMNQPGVYQPIVADGVRPFTLPRGVSFGLAHVERDDGEGFVEFFPQGEATPAVIQITDGNRSFTIRLAGVTGRAELLTGRHDELLEERMDLDAR